MKRLTEQNKRLNADKQKSIEQLRLKQLECDHLVQVWLFLFQTAFEKYGLIKNAHSAYFMLGVEHR